MSVDVRLVDYNYAFDSSVGITGTSENSEFPASNLAVFSRSKVWKSSGYFKITSSNNKINFKDSGGGSELTATLLAGEYTPTTLATEIASKMLLVSGATYTVSQSATTGRWTIATSGSYLSLLTNTGTDLATSTLTALGFDSASDHTGATTYTAADIAIHTEEGVVFDLRTQSGIDTFAIIIDPMLGNNLSANASVYVQASQTDSWTSPSVSQALTYSQEFQTWTHFFTTTQTYRYWRVKIVDPSNPNLSVELHKVVLGLSLGLTRNPEIGFKYSIKNQSKQEVNEYGYNYTDVYPDKRAFEFNLNLFEDADLVILEQSYKSFGNAAPVFFAIDTAGALFDKNQLTIYGLMRGDLNFNHQIIDRFSSTIQIEEFL